MSSIHYDKLVRDKIPEIIRAAGKQPVTDVEGRGSGDGALGGSASGLPHARLRLSLRQPDQGLSAAGRPGRRAGRRSVEHDHTLPGQR